MAAGLAARGHVVQVPAARRGEAPDGVVRRVPTSGSRALDAAREPRSRRRGWSRASAGTSSWASDEARRRPRRRRTHRSYLAAMEAAGGGVGPGAVSSDDPLARAAHVRAAGNAASSPCRSGSRGGDARSRPRPIASASSTTASTSSASIRAGVRRRAAASHRARPEPARVRRDRHRLRPQGLRPPRLLARGTARRRPVLVGDDERFGSSARRGARARRIRARARAARRRRNGPRRADVLCLPSRQEASGTSSSKLLPASWS
jgi:hypothetical protein